MLATRSVCAWIVFTASLCLSCYQACSAGEMLDATPFAVSVLDEPGKSYGVCWGEPRKIRSLEAEFDGAVPDPSKIRVQYWRHAWDGKPDPIQAESDTAGAGWTVVDDWTNGQWCDADARIVADGKTLRVTFAPSGEKEFPQINQPGVGYRRTLKIRLAADSMPKPRQFRAMTDAVCKPLTVRIVWDQPAVKQLAFQGENRGRLEVFNGNLVAVRPYRDSKVIVGKDGQWTLPAGTTGGIEADLLMAIDPADGRYDRTVVTVRTEHNPFSFAADEVARGDRIAVDDLGALVVRGDDSTSLADWRKTRCEYPGKTVYDRVTAEAEQTLPRAWNDMPLKRQLWFVHGLPGNRNAMRQEPNGEIFVTSAKNWFKLPTSPKDSDRKLWNGDKLTVYFGLPGSEHRAGRELLDGYLPQLRTWWVQGPLYYEQTTMLDTLYGDLRDIKIDDPTLLLVRIRIVNTSASATNTARLCMNTQDDQFEKLAIDGDRIFAETSEGRRLRFVFRTQGRGVLESSGNGAAWSAELAPGKSVDLYAVVPSITLTTEEEMAAVAKRDFNADTQRVTDFWKRMTAEGTQIETPEPWLNDFYRAMTEHLEINCVRDPAAPRRYARVGTFIYAAYGNESCMMINDLDRRGRHQAAEECLQAFLDFQGTAPLPGNFTDSDGVFNGSGGYECGGYNKHHGYIMAGMAEHWRFTRDRAWMEKAAPKLIKACDWVTRQRQATMKKRPDGTLPIEYGFLPTGWLEDVQDCWYWLATNVNTVWGFDALADALADYGHPEADRLKRDAKAYHDDVMRGLTEARIRTPVVRLRDSSYVPKYPSQLHDRGRSAGWIRETLEGSMFLLIDRLIPADAPEAAWILRDYEDNLYISDKGYGYAIPVFEKYWFSRGGFSMQANLLEGPQPYLYRDDVKHFLRAYFNSFASAFFPEIRMCNEHSIPELGTCFGDHFKSSDESNSCGWLRSMFIHEQGDDLYLGQAIPRYWLAQGRCVGIQQAASYFGPLSFRITSDVEHGKLTAQLTPPERNRPEKIYLRFRHPDNKPIQSVTINGKDCKDFNAGKEWVVLPGSIQGPVEVVVTY